ncbi:hypothetical protein HHI36_015539 [Cryptolaemus montrouzieri]|uniref:Uncharacterized protein n=1 Tax=Cryptolaemus montrouzieri TaxID=559131 RepID=A0ABD2N5V7_9CUCU
MPHYNLSTKVYRITLDSKNSDKFGKRLGTQEQEVAVSNLEGIEEAKNSVALKFATEVLPLEHGIAEVKLKDVDSLLKELFEENWRSDENFPGRMWYTELVDKPSSPPDEPSTALQEDL